MFELFFRLNIKIQDKIKSSEETYNAAHVNTSNSIRQIRCVRFEPLFSLMPIRQLQQRWETRAMPKETNHSIARINPAAPVNPTDWQTIDQFKTIRKIFKSVTEFLKCFILLSENTEECNSSKTFVQSKTKCMWHHKVTEKQYH